MHLVLIVRILSGTGRYCRSSKYHDKAVDVLHHTGNGFLITASQGSKFVKVWRIERKDRDPDEYENTEVTELQILREHTEYLTTFRVHRDTIYSSCADGQVLCHSFPTNVPHYEMATEQDPTASSVVCRDGNLATVPEDRTEICYGARLCRTGKTGLVKSSSSFQVSFKLKPTAIKADSKLRLPATVVEEDSESGTDDGSSSEYDYDEEGSEDYYTEEEGGE